jgi:thiosulfate/3-mercaptopyruvate sulfurtransferase
MGGMTPVITAAELAATLGGPGAPVLLDVRWRLTAPTGSHRTAPTGRPGYEAGHLPGAVYVDLETELSGPPAPGAGRHPLPDPDVLGAAMRRAGVRHDSEVVTYDDGHGWAAARAWWLLRWAGHRAVRVLDGGLDAWDGPLTTEVPAPPPGDFVPVPGSLPVLGADDAAAMARTGVLLDARAGDRYRGETEPVDPVAGHIPGAVSAPTTENCGPGSTLLDPGALAARFHGLGITPGTPVGVYCGSGVSGAHEVLALAVAGIDASLYAGSWSAWCSDASRPVATGPEPG